MGIPRWLAALALPVRAAVVGALVLGVLGGAAGLVIGLIVHWPTAWFAVLEVGVPAAFVGGLIGLAGGSVAWVLGLRGAAPDRGGPKG